MIAAAPVSLSGQSLAPYAGQVYQVGLAAGIEGVRVTIADKRPAPTGRGFVATAPLQLAFVPSKDVLSGTLSVPVIDPTSPNEQLAFVSLPAPMNPAAV